MTKYGTKFSALALGLGMAGLAHAAEIKVEAVMSPKETIKLDFEDSSKQFFLMVRREGQATGSAPLAGTSVTEFGVHDITPGIDGTPHGYLVFKDGDKGTLYIKWQVRAIFVPGPDGKPTLLDNGFWEVHRATGRFAKLKGAGTLFIKAASPTDRRFILNGDLVEGK